jgi:hypothetical protein
MKEPLQLKANGLELIRQIIFFVVIGGGCAAGYKHKIHYGEILKSYSKCGSNKNSKPRRRKGM